MLEDCEHYEQVLSAYEKEKTSYQISLQKREIRLTSFHQDLVEGSIPAGKEKLPLLLKATPPQSSFRHDLEYILRRLERILDLDAPFFNIHLWYERMHAFCTLRGLEQTYQLASYHDHDPRTRERYRGAMNQPLAPEKTDSEYFSKVLHIYSISTRGKPWSKYNAFVDDLQKLIMYFGQGRYNAFDEAVTQQFKNYWSTVVDFKTSLKQYRHSIQKNKDLKEKIQSLESTYYHLKSHLDPINTELRDYQEGFTSDEVEAYIQQVQDSFEKYYQQSTNSYANEKRQLLLKKQKLQNEIQQTEMQLSNVLNDETNKYSPRLF